MTRDDLRSLQETVKLSAIYRRAGLTPATMRSAMTSQPRPLSDEESEALHQALTELRDDLDSVLSE